MLIEGLAIMADEKGTMGKYVAKGMAVLMAPVVIMTPILFFAGSQDFNEKSCKYFDDRDVKNEGTAIIILFLASVSVGSFTMFQKEDSEDSSRRSYLMIFTAILVGISTIWSAVIVLTSSCNFETARGTSTNIELAGYFVFALLIMCGITHYLDHMAKVIDPPEKDGKETSWVKFKKFGFGNIIAILYLILSVFIFNYADNGHGIDQSNFNALSGCVKSINSDSPEAKAWNSTFRIVKEDRQIETRAVTWAWVFLVSTSCLILFRMALSYFDGIGIDGTNTRMTQVTRVLTSIAHIISDVSLAWWFAAFVSVPTPHRLYTSV